jgi:hypothetical protein
LIQPIYTVLVNIRSGRTKLPTLTFREDNNINVIIEVV